MPFSSFVCFCFQNDTTMMLKWKMPNALDEDQHFFGITKKSYVRLFIFFRPFYDVDYAICQCYLFWFLDELHAASIVRQWKWKWNASDRIENEFCFFRFWIRINELFACGFFYDSISLIFFFFFWCWIMVANVFLVPFRICIDLSVLTKERKREWMK